MTLHAHIPSGPLNVSAPTPTAHPATSTSNAQRASSSVHRDAPRVPVCHEGRALLHRRHMTGGLPGVSPNSWTGPVTVHILPRPRGSPLLFLSCLSLRSVLYDPVGSSSGLHLSCLAVWGFLLLPPVCFRLGPSSGAMEAGAFHVFHVSRTSYSSESDLPGESNTWNMILELERFHADNRNVSILDALRARLRTSII